MRLSIARRGLSRASCLHLPSHLGHALAPCTRRTHLACCTWSATSCCMLLLCCSSNPSKVPCLGPALLVRLQPLCCVLSLACACPVPCREYPCSKASCCRRLRLRQAALLDSARATSSCCACTPTAAWPASPAVPKPSDFPVAAGLRRLTAEGDGMASASPIGGGAGCHRGELSSRWLRATGQIETNW